MISGSDGQRLFVFCYLLGSFVNKQFLFQDPKLGSYGKNTSLKISEIASLRLSGSETILACGRS